MIRQLVHHVLAGRGKVNVVLKEIIVSNRMGDHRDVIDQRVRIQAVDITRIGIDHHFIDSMHSMLITPLQFVVLHPPLPMGISYRETAVSGNLGDFVVGQHLDHNIRKIEPKVPTSLNDLRHQRLQFIRQTQTRGRIVTAQQRRTFEKFG
jgi:hypothetical protein